MWTLTITAKSSGRAATALTTVPSIQPLKVTVFSCYNINMLRVKMNIWKFIHAEDTGLCLDLLSNLSLQHDSFDRGSSDDSALGRWIWWGCAIYLLPLYLLLTAHQKQKHDYQSVSEPERTQRLLAGMCFHFPPPPLQGEICLLNTLQEGNRLRSN